MRRAPVTLLLAVAFITAATGAFAQRTTGTIIGHVTDDSGAVLPGVTVTIKGDTIVGTQTSISNEAGLYRFPALPPGVYSLSFALSGFTTLNRQGLKVSVGGTLEENASLKVGGMTEELTVVGESAVVDTTGNTVATTYDKDWVRNAPQRRFTFFDLINAAPGVSQNTSTSSRSTSFGSGTDENSYQLDGTDFTAPSTGAAWPWPNTDAIEEIEVLSLGAPAEYGGLQGAVFNVVTRQGLNAFHGDANFYYQHNDLTADNTKDLRNPDGSFLDHARPTTAALPLRSQQIPGRHRAALRPHQEGQALVLRLLPAPARLRLPAGHRSCLPRWLRRRPPLLQAQLADQHQNKVMFALHDDYYDIPERGTARTDPSALLVESGHNPSPNVTFTSVLSQNLCRAALLGLLRGRSRRPPAGRAARAAPVLQPRHRPHLGRHLLLVRRLELEDFVRGKVSHFADNFLGGSHDFKFGVQYNSGGSDYKLGYNDYIYFYEYEDGSRYGYGYTQTPFNQGGEMRAFGVSPTTPSASTIVSP